MRIAAHVAYDATMGKKHRAPMTQLDRTALGARIRAARTRRGMAAEDAARYMGVSVSTLYSWEEGSHMPRDMSRLASIIGTTVGGLHGEVPL